MRILKELLRSLAVSSNHRLHGFSRQFVLDCVHVDTKVHLAKNTMRNESKNSEKLLLRVIL